MISLRITIRQSLCMNQEKQTFDGMYVNNCFEVYSPFRCMVMVMVSSDL